MDTGNPPHKKSFYQVAYSFEEMADLLEMEMENSLDDEITAVRVATRRTLLKLEEDLETADFIRLVDRIHKGANTVANLLRTRRALSGLAADGIANAIAQIIQEIGTERDYKIL